MTSVGPRTSLAVPTPRSPRPAGARAAHPAPPRPMQASGGTAPRGAGWAFEFVWEGLRCLAHHGSESWRLVTAAGRDVTSHFPELAPSATGERGLVLDGVVVAPDALGRPDLAKLRRRHRVEHPSSTLQARTPVSLFVFDVLEVDGRSTARLPYRERRELLAGLDLGGTAMVVPPFFVGIGVDAVVDTARRYGLGGVVAKRLESTYQAGRRSRSWIETTVQRSQDVVVGGWVPSARVPGGVGALLVGVPVEGGLRYAGRVATGVTAAARREFDDAIRGLDRAHSPFAEQVPEETARQARWLAPRLVGQIDHRRWTPSGLLERPHWRGLRRDTHPAEVQAPVLTVLDPVVDLDLALDDLDCLDVPDRSAPAPVITPLATAPTTDEVEAALRSRFSQHFVHNTLTAIAAYVRTDPSRARTLLTEFADFTRYSFRSADELSTVAEELENAERYLTLERARFGARLRARVTLGDDVAGVVLPAFVVAPLVENAVRHGVEPVPGGGSVEVTATAVGAATLITVADDGAGTDPAALHAGTQGGLAEVRRRLQEHLGPDADLSVDTRPGVGTTVRLRVPARAAG